MQCEDNSKLRAPLSEVCQTTDIGCVPITDGKPTCTPQPDQLPIAFDPKTTTLWLFSCKTHEWIPFQKFTMCQLEALNLDNIRDICDALNIGVNYAGSGECKQGTITLRELAERILECIQLETKIITIGEGEGNKVKISIEGLPLDPVYVTGRNIWSEGGSGTEADPLRIATYDPICKWPVKTQADVNAASVKHLGACLDGEMSRVPYPVMPCSYPQITPEEMMAAMDKDLIVCVDGENLKVPVPYNLYEASPCASPLYTIQDTQAAGGRITILACDGGQTIRIPIEGSGFFSYNTDWIYECVPQTTGVPTSAPVSGTGPFRMDCDNSLWVWDCEGAGWRKVKDGLSGVPRLTHRDDVPDLCENLKFKAWYNEGGGAGDDPCEQKEVWLQAQQLSRIMAECETGKCNKIYTYKEIRLRPQYGAVHNYSRTLDLKKIQLVTLPDGASENGNWKMAIWNCANRGFERGSVLEWKTDGDGNVLDQFDDDPNVGQVAIELYADPKDFDCKAYFDIEVSTEIVYDVFNIGSHNYTFSVIAAVDEEPNHSWESEFTGAKKGDNHAFLPPKFSQASVGYSPEVTGYWWEHDTKDGKPAEDMSKAKRQIACSSQSTGGSVFSFDLDVGQRKTVYLQAFIIFSSTDAQIDFGTWDFGFVTTAKIRGYRGLRI